MRQSFQTIFLVLTAMFLPIQAQTNMCSNKGTTLNSSTKGDVNSDGEINIADVNLIISIILSGDSNSDGDVNSDGEINIADVNTVIGIILGGSIPTPPGDEIITVNGVSFKMIYVEGGSFRMGRDYWAPTNRPPHQVTLSNYHIGMTEVTQELWMAVMLNNPSYFSSKNGYNDLQRPVEYVSWEDCQTFITKLNQITGKQFRLPTEAEWEYAARGGKKSKGYDFSGSNNIDDVAWYENNAGSKVYGTSNWGSHTVATKAPNELGIYDMTGNIYEFCNDWYDENYYSHSPVNNPQGPESGTYKVMRGACWASSDWWDPHVWIRSCSLLTSANNCCGFRLAL